MKTLKNIPHLEGVKVLLRADFNAPIRNGEIADDFRIRVALPTIEFLTSKGAKVILISHAEANDGSNDSLEPVALCLEKLGRKVMFIKNFTNAHERIEEALVNGGCALLENLRMQGDGEKKNLPGFAHALASLADIYVNEAFSVSHRVHASIVGIPEYLPSYAGIQFEKEVTYLSRSFNPPHPFLFILGGAKSTTKLPLIEKFMQTADTVFIGGALANDLLKEKGYEVGMSLVSGETIDFRYLTNNPKLLLPVDVTTQHRTIKSVKNISSEDQILDAGPKTVRLLREKIKQAKFVLWNGPLGMYEEGFRDPTLELATIVADTTSKGIESIVGGGDTVGAIASLGLTDKFTFISTGGGAMLDFLIKGTLPGIEALEKSV